MRDPAQIICDPRMTWDAGVWDFREDHVRPPCSYPGPVVIQAIGVPVIVRLLHDGAAAENLPDSECADVRFFLVSGVMACWGTSCSVGANVVVDRVGVGITLGVHDGR